MARVTVEDCLARVDNRFELVVLATKRAKQLIKGHQTLLDQQYKNRQIVMALREIAAGKIWPKYEEE